MDIVLVDNNNNVENVIVCESLEKAMEFFPDKKCFSQRENNPATVGGVYDEELDVFKGIKPFPSWVWNNDIKMWEAPVLKDPSFYAYWDEDTLSWIPNPLPE